jgi:hypothetical protein
MDTGKTSMSTSTSRLVRLTIAREVPANGGNSALGFLSSRNRMAGSRNKLKLGIIVINMKVFKIILGIIIIALGLGMAAAGWVVATQGQWTPVINIFLGFSLAFTGFGFAGVGIMLVRDSTVRDALGGIVIARSGQSGIGLHNEETYNLPPRNIREVLLDILRYTIIAICVILIAIFSIFRVTHGFPIDRK